MSSRTLIRTSNDLAEQSGGLDSNLNGCTRSCCLDGQSGRSKTPEDIPRGRHKRASGIAISLRPTWQKSVVPWNGPPTILVLIEDAVFADEDSPIPFPVGELPEYVEALAADQSGRDIAQFVDTLTLRIRGIVAGGRLSHVVQTDDNASPALVRWLEDYIGTDNASNGPIAVLDLSLVPSEVMHVVVSVLGRMVFEALQRYRRRNGCELPTTLVLEEAHTFIHRDLHSESTSPAGRECSRVFERIAREGRKFGMGLVLASQRPSEISPTVLSQCNTFLLHRLVNDRDQDLVRRLCT